MKRLLISLALGAILFTSGCLPLSANKRQRPITHIVVCWLKTPGDETARRRLIEDSLSFREIPGVMAVWAGPAQPSDNPAADRSFDVAVVMRFRNARALADYAKHPMHRAAVERTLKPLVAKYVVYDLVE